MNNKNDNMPLDPMDIIEADEEALLYDPFGSYTGRPEDPDEVPTQDADDL